MPKKRINSYMGHFSIRTKIIAVMIGTTLFFGLSMIVFAKTIIYQKLFAKIQEKGAVMAIETALDCVNPVVTEELFEVEMKFKDMMASEKDIVYLFITDKDNRVLAHTFPGGVPDELKTAYEVNPLQQYAVKELTTDKGAILDFGVPLLKGEIGVLRMGISESSIRRDVNSIVMLIILFSLFVMIAGSVAATIFSNVITRPILKLAGAAAAFGRGEMGQDVIITSDDEIGELVKVFNAMVKNRLKADEEVLRSLKEKEVMLQEIHHRVKNNLQVVHSLLGLQAEGTADGTARAMFEESRNRIKSMALIHEKLYESKDVAHVDFKTYLQGLVSGIANAYRRYEVVCFVEMETVVLNINVGIPCGLIVNELVTNSIKYAFPEGKKGTIKVGVNKKTDGAYVLAVEDNGIGFPEEVYFRNTSSLGLLLVNVLTRQICGTIELSRANGTMFSVTFPGDSNNRRKPNGYTESSFLPGG
ncbi:MAG: HAMP domain-containing protein [Nitrospirae bacterium]|nr:HAMP domain-containing protein [Nitrospirota bacterium]